MMTRYNFGYGLQELSEECLEACNKYVRIYRENLARKTSFSDNFRDILVRLLCFSDPVLAVHRQKSLRKAKQKAETVVKQSQQDSLYDFLIIN